MLTLHKDEVSIRWPLEVQYEIDYIYDPIHKESQVRVDISLSMNVQMDDWFMSGR